MGMFGQVPPPGARAGQVAFSVRLPGMRPLAKGEPVALAIDAAQLHLFREDGNAIR